MANGQFLKRTFVLSLALIFTAACKNPSEGTLEQAELVNQKSSWSTDIAKQCDLNPGSCSAFALLSKINYTTSCLNLWDQTRDTSPTDPSIYAFDENGNSYSKSDLVKMSDPTRKKAGDGRTWRTTLGEFLTKRMNGEIPIDIPGRLAEFYTPEVASKVPYQGFPVGFRDRQAWGTTPVAVDFVLPNIIAVKAESPWQQNKDVQEWLYFQVQLAPDELFTSETVNGKRVGRETEWEGTSTTIRKLLFSTCTILGAATTPKPGKEGLALNKLSIVQQMDLKHEGTVIRAKAKTLDQVYNGMVTFVELAPGTSEIATLYHGCYMQEKSCLRALVVVAANVAAYATMGGTSMVGLIGANGYYLVMKAGAVATAIEIGSLVKDTIHEVKGGQYSNGAVASGTIVVRSNSLRGLVLEAMKAY